MPELGYESRQLTTRSITLEVGSDGVCLTIPPPPRWLTMGAPAFWLLVASFQVVMCGVIINTMRRMGAGSAVITGLTAKQFAWLAFDVVGFTLVFAWAVAELVAQIRFGTV